ncbi:MAG: class I SAM-dependent methyltransferase [Chloroflexi bacterium]|nr:class I SAM-dependent methyltransferase [Chloroflexota bacterium]
MKTKRWLRQFAARHGVFIARYQPDYVYASCTNQVLSIEDELFYQIACPVIKEGRTLLGYDRLYVLWQAVKNTSSLQQITAELGSYRGGSAYFLATALKVLNNSERPVHIFDTFKGHPDTDVYRKEMSHKPGLFSDTDYESVKQYLSDFQHLHIHQGDIYDTLKDLPEMNYGLVHLDVDVFETTLDCLRYFGQRLVSKGMMVLDDYRSPNCPGIAHAIDIFLAEQAGHFESWFFRTEQLILVKA